MTAVEIEAAETALISLVEPLTTDATVEMAALASLLAWPEKAKTAPTVSHSDFSDPMLSAAFEAAMRLASDGALVPRGGAQNAMAVTRAIEHRFENLKSDRAFLVKLAARAAASFDLSGYAKTIRDMRTRREFVRLTASMAASAGDKQRYPTASELISELGERVAAMGGEASSRIVEASSVSDRIFASLDADVPKYSTGFLLLDECMGGGMYPGKLYGISARKKQGKTLIASQISESLCEQKVPHVYVCLEMGSDEIQERLMARRMLTNALSFKNQDLRRSEKFKARFREARGGLNEHCLHYIDAPGMTFDRLRSEINFLIASKGVKGFVLDYLQLVSGAERNETEAKFLDRISQWMADIVKRNKLFGLALSQINQEGNIRGGEGFRLFCDQAYELKKVERATDGGEIVEAYLTMMETRYTKWMSVGDEDAPALFLHQSIGPMFAEIGTEKHARIRDIEERRAASRSAAQYRNGGYDQ